MLFLHVLDDPTAAMNVIVVLAKKLVGLLLGILSIFRHLLRRVMCWTGRGRRMSGSVLPFTTDQVAPVGEIQQSLPSNNVSERGTAFPCLGKMLNFLCATCNI